MDRHYLGTKFSRKFNTIPISNIAAKARSCGIFLESTLTCFSKNNPLVRELMNQQFERTVVAELMAGPARKKKLFHVITGPRQVGKTMAAGQIKGC